MGGDEVAVLTGQQLALASGGAFAACTHRVAPTAAVRTSHVLEVARRVEEKRPDDPLARMLMPHYDPRGGFSR